MEIFLLYMAGKSMSQTTTVKGYWKASKLAFLSYILVHGFRFGFEIDWNHYCVRYLEATKMDLD